MSENEPGTQTVLFEKIIAGNTCAIVEDGSLLQSEATGETILFDRKAPDFETELQAFLEAQARAGTILRGDVEIWHLWLSDDGRASAATLMRGEATKARQGPQICHWQAYDFAGF
ncbi:MAG: hypothetical protein AAGF68_00685 [Pseudomonadota bacterium]